MQITITIDLFDLKPTRIGHKCNGYGVNVVFCGAEKLYTKVLIIYGNILIFIQNVSTPMTVNNVGIVVIYKVFVCPGSDNEVVTFIRL